MMRLSHLTPASILSSAAVFAIHDLERPQNPSFCNQRHAHEGARLKTKLFIYCVEEAGIFAGIRDEQRLAVFNHPADNALASGDTDPFQDRFFLSRDGVEDQLLRHRIPEKHGAGLGLEKLSSAFQSSFQDLSRAH